MMDLSCGEELAPSPITTFAKAAGKTGRVDGLYSARVSSACKY